MSEDVAVGAAELRTLAVKLQDLLKIRTLPIGMKQYESLEEMEKVPGLRRPKPGRFHTTCQLVTQSRIAGFTLGITAENVRPQSNCGGVMGIEIRHVKRHGGNTHACCGDPLHRRRQLVIVGWTVHRHREPPPGEGQGTAQADASRRSGHKRRLPAHVCAPFFRSSRAMIVR